MKKKLTRLACLWLAVIMLCTTAFAAEVTVKLYTGDTPLEAGNTTTYGSELTQSVTLSSETDKFKLYSEDVKSIIDGLDNTDGELVGWKLWKVGSDPSGKLDSYIEYDNVDATATAEKLTNDLYGYNKVLEPVWGDFVRNIHVLSYGRSVNIGVADEANVEKSYLTKFEHNFTGEETFELTDNVRVTDAAGIPDGYVLTGWSIWAVKDNVTAYMCAESLGTIADDGKISYSDLADYASYDDFIAVPVVERKYWITQHPTAENPTVCTNVDGDTETTLKYAWYRANAKAEILTRNSECVKGGDYSTYADGVWYAVDKPDETGEKDGLVESIWFTLNAFETVVISFGGDSVPTYASILTDAWIFAENRTESGGVWPGIEYADVVNGKIIYTTAEDIAVRPIFAYVNPETGEKLEISEDAYIEYKVIDMDGALTLSGEKSKTLSAGALIPGYSYFADVDVNDAHTLKSDAFYIDYSITHHPTTDEPYVETDGNDEVSSYTWYQIGEDGGVDTPLNDETEAELSTGEDGKEYYCVVEFTDGAELISDIFEWKTPEAPKKQGGGGLSAGGDKSTSGKDDLGDTSTTDSDEGNDGNNAAGNDAGTPPAAVTLFDDVPAGSWYENAANWMGQQGYMSGTGARTFSPNLETTRGMIVTVLWRMAGSPAPSGECPFEDVKPGAYYEDAITWAQENGVVTGHSDTVFAPDDLITREQLATIIYRNEVRKGMDAVTLEENLTAFEDAESVSEYAVTAMNWAVGRKIINGVSATKLAPQKTATRAECATMLYRMSNN